MAVLQFFVFLFPVDGELCQWRERGEGAGCLPCAIWPLGRFNLQIVCSLFSFLFSFFWLSADLVRRERSSDARVRGLAACSSASVELGSDISIDLLGTLSIGFLFFSSGLAAACGQA